MMVRTRQIFFRQDNTLSFEICLHAGLVIQTRVKAIRIDSQFNHKEIRQGRIAHDDTSSELNAISRFKAL